MIQELIERAGQYYTGFINLPVEGQAIGVVGLIVVLAALKTVWGMLYPVRWTAASLLRIAALLMHPRKRKPKKTDGVELAADVIPFNVSNKKKTIKTYGFYGGTMAVQNLTDSQIEVLSAAIIKFDVRGNGGLSAERRRRDELKCPPQVVDTNALEARIVELEVSNFNATQTPAPRDYQVVVERVVPSEADVA